MIIITSAEENDTKERSKRERRHNFEVCTTVQQKENGVTSHIGGFL